MKKIKTPPILNSLSDVVEMFFGEDGECHVSNSIPYFVILFLSLIAPEEYKIFISTSNEYMEDNSQLFKNGYIKEQIDNLDNVYIYKHKVKTSENECNYFTTSMSPYRGKNEKYSYFLRNLIMDLSSIEYLSYQKMSEIIELFTGIKVSRQRIFDIIENNFDLYCNECFEEIRKEIENLGINLNESIHYDEQFLWINHQPYVRLTLIDALNRIVIADEIIPREIFNGKYIKHFLKTSLKDLNVKYIITDGDNRYPKIIKDLGYIQQRCTFHLMKNLMDALSPRHLRLRRKIKTLNETIPRKEKELEELSKKYAGKRGRIQKEDKKRRKDKDKMNELTREISQLKAKRRKYKKILKEDLKIVKQIGKIFKSNTYQSAINKFERLYAKKKEFSEEIRKFLENLKDHLDDALHHTLNKNVPSTNNLIELFYKISFGGKLKRLFRTSRGAYKRMKLNEIRWTKRNVLTQKT